MPGGYVQPLTASGCRLPVTRLKQSRLDELGLEAGLKESGYGIGSGSFVRSQARVV